MKFSITLLLLIAFVNINAQKLETKKSFGDVSVFQNNIKLKMSEVGELMKKNELAFQQFEKASNNRTFAYIFSVSGGLLIGYPLGQAITGKDANWELMGAGAAFGGITFVFMSGYNKRVKNAVSIYNEDIDDNGVIQSTKLALKINDSGVGLVLTF